MYYTFIKHSGHLRKLEKCRKHMPGARVFYISLVFSNARPFFHSLIRALGLFHIALASKLVQFWENIQISLVMQILNCTRRNTITYTSLWKRAVAWDQSPRARAYGTVGGTRVKTNMAEFSAECRHQGKGHSICKMSDTIINIFYTIYASSGMTLHEKLNFSSDWKIRVHSRS